VNETFVEHWVADKECGANLLQLEGPDGNVRQVEGEDGMVHNLFAFPAEDNFAGMVQLRYAAKRALHAHCWDG